LSIFKVVCVLFIFYVCCVFFAFIERSANVCRDGEPFSLVVHVVGRDEGKMPVKGPAAVVLARVRFPISQERSGSGPERS
jgi:hypothetical protein